jgi:hypothetical protein
VWAIEEDSLSLIEDGLTDGEFTPIENVNSETFAITGSATYQCKFTEVTDTKILVYITSSSKNISI